MATVFAIFALVLLTPSLGAMNIFNTTEEEADFSERLDVLEAIVAEMMSKTENDSKLTEGEDKDVYVSTKYGKIKGLTFTTPEKERYDVFYGIPYARPPTGNHRFSQPRPLSPWFPDVKDATQLGNICMQQNTNKFNIATASEDCLNLNIFAPRPSVISRPMPVMMFIHGGKFREWSASYFNYTNLALKGVIVVTINYRLDAFGFLSTQDDVIPGNFGLMDAKLALHFVKEIIGDFGGDSGDVTLFGASAGSAMVQQMSLSPLTRGKFQKAIMQSGPGTCSWSSYKPETPFVPRQIAFSLGLKLRCPLPHGFTGRQASEDLLDCLRKVPADELISVVQDLTVNDFGSGIIFVPVSGDSFGFLPEHPALLAANTKDIVPIPMILGWTTDDSSWYINDPEDDGLTYAEFLQFIQIGIGLAYPPDQVQSIVHAVLTMYNMTDPSGLDPYHIREVAMELITDFSMKSFMAKEARQFSKAAEGSRAKVFVYEYHHRPSYSVNPAWQRVTHMDEEGMGLGLPNGPRELSYPQTSAHDRKVSELMTTWWSNFAKYGEPSPSWPKFGYQQDDQQLMIIRSNPGVKQFDGDDPVVLWTGSSGLED